MPHGIPAVNAPSGAGLTPDQDAARRHLETLFSWCRSAYPDGLVEIAHGAGRPYLGELFPVTPAGLDAAAAFAVAHNGPDCNVYVGIQPRRPAHANWRQTRPEGLGRAEDTDIEIAGFLYADGDRADSAQAFDQWGLPPSFSVTTGTQPEWRRHGYWRLATPLRDMAVLRRRVQAMASEFSSDGSVYNPSRILKLAGTVSYPNAKKRAAGYVVERCILVPETTAAPYRIADIARAGAYDLNLQGSSRVDIDSLLARLKSTAELGDGEWRQIALQVTSRAVLDGLSPAEIVRRYAEPLTHGNYSPTDTAREIERMTRGPFVEKLRARLALAATRAPGREPALEWFNDQRVDLTKIDLVEDLLDESSVGCLYGPPNAAKSFLVLDLCMHVAMGRDWFGRFTHQGTVVYLSAEGGGLAKRCEAYRRVNEWAADADVPLALLKAPLTLGGQADETAKLINHIHTASEKYGAVRLVVIDTLARTISGDENDSAVMGSYIKAVDSIVAETGATVLIIHHTGKNAAQGARGHSSLRGAVDTELEMEVDKVTGLRTMLVRKQRDVDYGQPIKFMLESIDLGEKRVPRLEAGHGKQIKSAVVRPATAVDAAAPPIGAVAQAALQSGELLDDGAIAGGPRGADLEADMGDAAEFSEAGYVKRFRAVELANYELAQAEAQIAAIFG